MTLARISPRTRTLGIQFLVMSIVLAFIDRICMTASRPMPVIATSRNATTLMILARMEREANIIGSLCWAQLRVRNIRINLGEQRRHHTTEHLSRCELRLLTG